MLVHELTKALNSAETIHEKCSKKLTVGKCELSLAFSTGQSCSSLEVFSIVSATCMAGTPQAKPRCSEPVAEASGQERASADTARGSNENTLRSQHATEWGHGVQDAP